MRDILNDRVREADSHLYDKLDRNRVRCYSCGHCCPIPEGQPGVCKVRFNRGGTLFVPWGYVAGMQCDPGMRPSLCLLPELGDVASAARPECRFATAGGDAGTNGS